jgi:hypothetical protein
MADKYTAVNAAQTATAVALQDLLDGLAAGTKVRFIFGPSNVNGTQLSTGDFPGGFGAAGSAANFTTYTYTVKVANSTANMVYALQEIEKALGYVPLFWKVAASNSNSLAVT